MKKGLLVIFLFFYAQRLFCSVDLEEDLSSFVLETKQIEIPGYPHAFNPSIIRWGEKLLMSFRVIPNPERTYNSEIGVVWLDDAFNPITTPQILDLCPSYISPDIPSRAEDGRLINVGGSLYLVYSDNRNKKISKGGFRVYIAKLEVSDQKIFPKEIEPLLHFEGESQTLREKNWVPFDFEGELLLAYSLSPHRIFRYLPGTFSAENFIETPTAKAWDFGILRGGTPALNIHEEFYLSFFHSSKKMQTVHSENKETLHYFMGAYTYSLKPPFQIMKMSPKPIIGKNFYHGKTYKPYWHPVQAVFPCGYICEQNNISVFYGRQDHEIWVITIDKNGLLDSLQNVH